MKTNNLLTCWKSLLCLVGLLLYAYSSWAKYGYRTNVAHYDFRDNSICYRIISEAAKTVAVTYRWDVWLVNDDDDDDHIIGNSSDYSGDIVIPKSVVFNNVTYDVVMIDAEAFSDCANLTSLILPQSIKSIGNQAFDGCISLKKIIIPESVTSVGISAFQDCRSLTVNIQVSDFSAFCNNKIVPLIRNKIGRPIILIDVEGKEIKEYIIPDDVTSIGDFAFYNCSGLYSMTIPNSVESIGNYAFYGCSGLTSITIPNSVTSIGSSAFHGCGFNSIIIPNSVNSIGNQAFSNCSNLSSVQILSNDITIANNAFSDCNNFTFLILNCNDIGTWFSGIKSIKDIEIGGNTTSIAESAFANCSGIESVTIGKNVTSIGYSAFSRCSNLKSVISMIEDPYCIDVSVFQYSLTANTVLYVPKGKKELYKEKSCWNQFPNIEEFSDEWDTDVDMTIEILSETDKTVQIGNGTDAAISTETAGELVIPSKVTRNGKTYTVVGFAESAFNGCSKLTSVVIPSSITSSGNNAFNGCTGLQKVIVSDLKAWCAIAFSSKPSNPLYYAKHLYSDANTEIIDLVIPDGVPNIEPFTFIKGNFKTVTVPGSVSEIRKNSFYKCISLTSLNIAKGVSKIRTNAFYGCAALKSISLPEGMTRIGTSSFYECTALENIELPSSISEIANTAFKLCSNLKQVTSNILSPKAFGTESFTSISTDCKLYVPVGTLQKYYTAGWTKEVFAGGIVEVGDVEVNYNIENPVTADFIKNVVYPNDDYSFTKITDYTTVSTSYRKDLPSPVRIEAPVTNDGKSLLLETYSNGVLVRSDNFLVGQRALEIWNLIPQTQYTYKLYLIADDDTKSEVSQGAFKTEGQVRMMKIDNVRNFRDIGGWKLANGKYIKYDKIFRSAELETTSQIINTSGINEMLDVQGIGVEIDFGDYDGSPVSDRLEFFRGSDYQIYPCVDGVKIKGTQLKNCFVKVVESLRKGKKILFHCTAGADRTGTFAFLLEGLLGISESDLAKDYELTSLIYDRRYRNVTNTTYENQAYLNYKGLIEYVKSSFSGNTINEKIEQMALSFGISQTDINDFRDLMTEPNALSLSDVSILKDNTAKCSVNMANKNEIAAFQFDVEIPQGVTLTGVQLGNRKSSSHTVEFSKNEDGNYRVVCVSLQSVSFSGNEGELISLMLSEDGTIKKGDYDISIKNIVLTSPSNVKYYPADASAPLTVLDCRQGDADGDGIIDVADVVLMVNYILGKPSPDFVFQASDLNGDGEIDVFDVMMAINLVLSQNSSSRSYVRDANETTLESMFMTIDNEGVNLSIDNPGRFSAFQFELALPEGTMLTEAKLADSKDTHLIKFDQIGTNCYRVMAVSLDNLAFSTTASELLRLTLSSNNGASVVIDNIRFVTPEGEKVLFSVSHENSATAIKEIVKEQEAVIYDLSGRKFTVSENLPKGVYIINNKKVVIK